MTDRGERFDHPLIERYASRDMARLFSPRERHTAWRDLWICLAEAQHELGFPVSREQIDELSFAHKVLARVTKPRQLGVVYPDIHSRNIERMITAGRIVVEI